MIQMKRTSGRSRQAVLAALTLAGPLSRAELAERTGLPLSTIIEAVSGLLAEGVLEGTEARRRGVPGRPPAVLRIGPRASFVGVLGVSRGGLYTAVIGSDATVRGKLARPVDFSHAEGGMHLLVELLDRVVAVNGVTRDALGAVVLSLPAPVSHGRPTTLRADVPSLAPEYSGRIRWIGTDPGGELEALLGRRVNVENDANLAALGEAVYGSGRPFSNVVYVMMVGGLGGGVVLNKTLIRGADGLVGEFGHLHLDDDGPMCVCGARGCLGASVSFAETLKRMEPAFDRKMTVERLSELCAQGHRPTLRLLRDLGEEIGNALGAACVVLNPDAIIVDGTLQDAAAPVIDGIRAGIERNAPTVAADVATILPGALHDAAPIYGALAVSCETP